MFKKIILGVGVLAALVAMLIFSGRIPVGKSKVSGPVGNIEVWGTLPQSQVESLFQSISNTAKTYRLTYYEIPEAEFSGKLLNSLASGGGPDLILAPYQIILENRSRVYLYPPNSFSEQQYRDLFVDGASIFYTEGGALALPISVSPLVMFYNRTLLSAAGIINPPVLWDDLAAMVPKLTVIDSNNRISQSAIALGAYSNINAAKDILMTIVYQLGQIPVYRYVSGGQEMFTVLANTPLEGNDTVRPLTSSLRFYSEFANPAKNIYSWSQLLPNAQDQFIAEKLVMYIGYADEEKIIKAKNPRVDFGVKFLPQTKSSSIPSTGMKLYGLSTLKRSTNLTSALTIQSLLTGSQYGPTIASIAGGFSPLKYVLEQSTGINPEYKKSMLVAKGWYDEDEKNSERLTQYMINDVLSGRRNISEAAESFVTSLTESYTK
jgi:ABC-type glycerol-3-phosphate transport system substrate-binding protein